jgi:hypothetical protein
MQSFRIPIAAVTLSALLLGPSPAWAAKKKRASSTQSSAGALETYSAEDPDPMETSASAISIPAGEAAGVAPASDRERPGAPSAGSVRSQSTPLAPASASRWQTAAFDRVPLTQADGIARRLRLVEDIMRRHGRAYDYRSLTVHDLEMILAELDAQAELQSRNAK